MNPLLRARSTALVLTFVLGAAACSSRQASEAVSRWVGREAAHEVVREGKAAAPSLPAVSAECASQLPPTGVPAFDNPKTAIQAVYVCRSGYTLLHSGVTRTPLWSAETLTPERVIAARAQPRNDVFHAEPSLPSVARAELPDYVRSGYDRGHLAPSGDMPTASTQAESFSLANIAPQSPRLNRGPWEQLESAVRQRALHGTLHVITGVAFRGASIGFLKGRVAVPTEFYKLVYDASSREASVFVASNQDTGEVVSLDVAVFEAAFGIHFNLGAVAPLHLGSAPSRHTRRH